MNDLNNEIFYWFNNLATHGRFVDSLIVFLATTLPWILLLFTIFYFLFFRKNVKKFFVISFMVISSVIVAQFLKLIVFRHPRPFVVLPYVIKLINITGFDSFPSGHATAFAALTTGVFIYNRALGVIFMVATLFIGFARVSAGIHYPLDILTGYIIGILMAFISYRFLGILSRALKRFIS
jgi:undecaprenyl-diphosphatase